MKKMKSYAKLFNNFSKFEYSKIKRTNLSLKLYMILETKSAAGKMN